jgi:hypothetical protein
MLTDYCKNIFLKKSVYVVVTACLLFFPTVNELQAEELRAQAAFVSAPLVSSMPRGMRSLIRKDAGRFFDSRQAHLRDHYKTTPLAPLSDRQIRQGLRAATKPINPTDISPLDTQSAAGERGVSLMFSQSLGSGVPGKVMSTVNEPSIASRGREVFFTGNWYAAFSKDGGRHFSYVNPYTAFPRIKDQDFCCDQLADYDPRHDMMVWMLQYATDKATGQNTIRIAVSSRDDIRQQNWFYYSFTPRSVGGWKNEWFDYPAMVVGKDYLYLTTNVFSTGKDQFTRSVILRLPLAQLAKYKKLDYSFISNKTFTWRPTHGAGSIMYFAAHQDQKTLKIIRWPEDRASYSTHNVGVDIWSAGSSTAQGPDNREWMARSDHRVKAAWLNGETLGVAWTVRQDKKHAFPHVRVALINTGSLTVAAQPHIWNPGFAFAYPAVAVNSDGVVGIALFYGGGQKYYPNLAVGILGADNRWRLTMAAKSTNGPDDGKWGDYMGIRPDGGNPRQWVVAGFTLQGGADRKNVRPHFIRFKANGSQREEAGSVSGAQYGRHGRDDNNFDPAYGDRGDAPAPGTGNDRTTNEPCMPGMSCFKW